MMRVLWIWFALLCAWQVVVDAVALGAHGQLNALNVLGTSLVIALGLGLTYVQVREDE